MRMIARLAGALTVLLTVGALAAPSQAQNYPSRPITIMVFVGPGGAPDIIARLIGQALSQRQQHFEHVRVAG